MDAFSPLLALATLLVNLRIKHVADLGGALVNVAGKDAAKTFVAALNSAVESAQDEADEDFEHCCYESAHGLGCSCNDPAPWEQKTPALNSEQRSVVVAFGRTEKIAAMKTARVLTGWDLGTAKAWADRHVQHCNSDSERVRGVIAHNVNPEMADAMVNHFRLYRRTGALDGCRLDVYSTPMERVQAYAYLSQLEDLAADRDGYGWGVEIWTRDEGVKISMIKALRDSTAGVGLKNAKALVDAAYRSNNIDNHTMIHCDLDLTYERAVACAYSGAGFDKDFPLRDQVKVLPCNFGGERVPSAHRLSSLAAECDLTPSEAGFFPY
jgi:ribosomal protein L7/L12